MLFINYISPLFNEGSYIEIDTSFVREPWNLHVFRLWEKTEVFNENPNEHGESMQTPCREDPAGQDSNPCSSGTHAANNLIQIQHFHHRSKDPKMSKMSKTQANPCISMKH